jgi:DHA1 family 2-module integral membrane pump EmrD-like MFS transporter
MNPVAPRANHPRFLLFLICAFASAGQLAIDLYVPALPKMAVDYATSAQAIQTSVTGYLIAYAFGQLVFGPLADACGRKRILVLGSVCSRWAACSRWPPPTWKPSSRRGCCRASALRPPTCWPRPSSPTPSRQTLVHAYTYMAIAWGLAPIIAPVIGAHLQEAFGWRSCLVFLLVYSFAMWAMLWRIGRHWPGRCTCIRPPCSECAHGAGSPVFQSCFLAPGTVLQHPAGVQHRRPLHGAEHLAPAAHLLRLPGLAIGMMYFLGGISNRIHHRSLPSAEQRLRIGARVMTVAAFAMLALALLVGLTVWTLITPVLVMAFCAGAMYPADGQGQFDLPAHCRTDQRHPGLCAAAGVLGDDGIGRFCLHP